MITTTVTASIARDDRRADRRVIGELYGIPVGSRLALDVGDRELVELETVAHLREYVDVLHIDLHGTTRAVAAWSRALRGSEWAVR